MNVLPLILLVIPALILVVPRSGTTGAAAVWAGLNAGYVIVGAPLSFQKLMPTEMGRWYVRDTAVPLASALAACLAVRAAGSIVPPSKPADTILLIAAGVATFSASLAAAPLVRMQAAALLGRFRHPGAAPDAPSGLG
jgi:hypothetical protein